MPELPETLLVVYVDQSYANYVGEPEAAFTDRDLADEYIAEHIVPSDCHIVKVPLNPAPTKRGRP